MEYFFKFLSVLAWPATLVFICFKFEKEISDLLVRLKSTTFAGNSLQFRDPSKQNNNIKDEVMREDETLPTIYESQSEVNNLILQNLKSDEKINEHYRIYFPFILLNFIFYKIYTNIFGTQIALLFYLQKINQAGLEQLIEFYNQGKNQNPEVYCNIKFDAYLAFLAKNGLIERKSHYYQLTAMGRDFLKFLDFEKLPGRNF